MGRYNSDIHQISEIANLYMTNLQKPKPAEEHFMASPDLAPAADNQIIILDPRAICCKSQFNGKP